MSKTPKSINYTKWSFILGTPIALAGLVIALIKVPEIRCKFGIDSTTCIVQQKDVELRVATEEGTALPGVKILVSAKGAPETIYTDSNGYAKVRVPSEGDASINLSKAGYPPQNFTINLAIDQSTTRTIRLSKSGNLDIRSDNPASPSTSVSSNIVENKSAFLDSTCQSSTPGTPIENILFRDSGKLTFGKEIVEAVAFLGGGGIIYRTSPIQFVCGLNDGYKELKMEFGVNSANIYAFPGNKIEFEVFLEGKSAGKRIVATGSKQQWSLNIQGIHNVSFQAICLTDQCPALVFSELSLK
jgi:Carboxypeptidase regulatory-like domain